MTIPVNVSWRYQLPPALSSDWVEIMSIEDGIVTVEGLYGDTAAWSTPVWKFPDFVVSYEEGGYFLLTEDDVYVLSAEDGDELLGI